MGPLGNILIEDLNNNVALGQWIIQGTGIKYQSLWDRIEFEEVKEDTGWPMQTEQRVRGMCHECGE